jgi:hypothetical protein
MPGLIDARAWASSVRERSAGGDAGTRSIGTEGMAGPAPCSVADELWVDDDDE